MCSLTSRVYHSNSIKSIVSNNFIISSSHRAKTFNFTYTYLLKKRLFTNCSNSLFQKNIGLAITPSLRCLYTSSINNRNSSISSSPLIVKRMASSNSSISNCNALDNKSFEDILIERITTDSIAIIKINRPKSLNALRNETCNEIQIALNFLENDDSIRCVIITGSGDKSFVAGADIKQMQQMDFASANKTDFFSSWSCVQSFRKPIIAAVNGYALGGGCELAMMCDIIICSDNAKFGQPEILLGTIPGMGGTQRLCRAVGKSKSMEWILTGRQWTAKEALDSGLVSKVVPSDTLEKEAINIASSIAKFSSPAIIAAKECVNRSYESSLQEGLLYERRMFHGTFANDDRKEGMTAFVEKRQPNWRHQ